MDGSSNDAGQAIRQGSLEARITRQAGLVGKILAARAAGAPAHAAAIEALARAGLDSHQNRLLTAHLAVSGTDGSPPRRGRSQSAWPARGDASRTRT